MHIKSTILRVFLLTVLLGVQVNAETEQIDVGTLIDRVIAGEDFSGQELIVSGVALNQTTSGEGRVVNVGTRETYKSGSYLNFVSVYDTSVTIKEGAVVRLLVAVEMSRAANLGGESYVMIDTAFRECLSC